MLLTPSPPLINLPLVRGCFVGIDPSLTSTGIALIENGQMQTGLLSPPFKGPERLSWFYDEFVTLIGRNGPTIVALEGYAFGAKAQHHALGELGGVLRLALHRTGQPFLVVPPTTLKKFATGKGNADKSAVSKELFKRFRVDLNRNDEVDAAGLAIVGLACHATGTRLAAVQKKALEGVERFDPPACLKPVAKSLDKGS
jgi:crossover junction endodeoxyribonuclease RuvC